MKVTIEELMLIRNFLRAGKMYSTSPEPIAKGIWTEHKAALLNKVEKELVKLTT